MFNIHYVNNGYVNSFHIPAIVNIKPRTWIAGISIV